MIGSGNSFINPTNPLNTGNTANTTNSANLQTQGSNKSHLGLSAGNKQGIFGNYGSNWTAGRTGLGILAQPNKPLIQEDMTLAKIEEESKNTPDMKQALKIIIDLYDLVNKYEQKMKPVDGAEAFEKKLIELEDDTNRAIVHTIMALAREIDHGKAFITEYTDKLTMYRRDVYAASRGSHELPSPFLSRYVESLKNRKSNITQAVDSFTEYLNSSSNSQSPQTPIYVLQHQKDAIVRCSARISKIKEKSEQIQQKMKDLMKNRNLTESTITHNSENGAEESSFSSKTVMDDYEKFKKDRIRDLEKRETDKSKFKKAPQTGGLGTFGTSGYGLGGSSYGFGAGNSAFGAGASAFGTGANSFGNSALGTGVGAFGAGKQNQANTMNKAPTGSALGH